MSYLAPWRSGALSVCSAALLTSLPAAAAGADSAYDRVWSAATLYHDAGNPLVQKIQFTGRLQFDQAFSEAGDDREHDEFNVRRLRAGFKISLLEDFTLHSEADLDPQADTWYQRLTDTYLAWSPDPRLEITVGKQGAGFTLDGMTSSKSLLTIDRSNVANNIWFPTEYLPGVTVGGEYGKFSYQVGGFSSGAADRGFGDFDGGWAGIATVGYDFAGALGAEEALLRLNFVQNEKNANNSFTRSLGRVLSTSFLYDAGRWGASTEYSEAGGYRGQSDLAGFVLMPWYELTDRLQIVGRYTLVDSESDNGVRFARYESEYLTGRGDRYDEFYLGLNYYFYGHKLKLQSGLSHFDMDDAAGDGGAHDGWSWTTGLRLSW